MLESLVIAAFIILDVLPGVHLTLVLVLCDCGYHQAMEDDGNLVFCCGEYLSATPSSWDGSYSAQCGLFNTSGDTSPAYPYWTQYIGSLNDYIHETDGASGGFILVGLYFVMDPFGFDHGFSGIYYSGGNSGLASPLLIGSQYYFL